MTKQRLPHFVGISGTSAGATRISLNLVVIPPNAAAEPHSHRGFESAVYMMRGQVDVRYRHALERLLTLEEGDFLFIPADLPHQPINRNPVEPALAIVARNDANEQESVEIFSDAEPRQPAVAETHGLLMVMERANHRPSFCSSRSTTKSRGGTP